MSVQYKEWQDVSFEPGHFWKIRIYSDDLAQDLESWRTNRQKDYAQLVNVAKLVASVLRVRDPKKVKPWDKNNERKEMVTKNGLRLYFFYDDDQIVLCTNCAEKSRSKVQNRQFEACYRIYKKVKDL